MNFAGKYAIILNSCGTGNRRHTLHDLSTGQSLDTLAIFATAEAAPTTKEGFPYVTDLGSRGTSDILVAQYRVDAKAGSECRERVFVFKDEILRPITKTKASCSSFCGSCTTG